MKCFKEGGSIQSSEWEPCPDGESNGGSKGAVGTGAAESAETQRTRSGGRS